MKIKEKTGLRSIRVELRKILFLVVMRACMRSRVVIPVLLSLLFFLNIETWKIFRSNKYTYARVIPINIALKKPCR